MPRLRSGLLLSLMITSLTYQAEAILIEIDLPGGNLNEVTRDTVTGLDWLDLTATTNISFTNAITTAIGSFGAGWRHATGTEVCSLFAREAFAPNPCPSNVGIGPIDDAGARVRRLQTLLGVTLFGPIGPYNGALGFYDDGTGGSVGHAQLISQPASIASVRNNHSSETNASADTGNFLVRVVPEPSTGLLMMAGLVGLAARRRMRA